MVRVGQEKAPAMSRLSLSWSETETEVSWPSLTTENAEVKSPDDPFYNCAAFVADDTERKWWPIDQEGYYWPEGFPRDDSTETILKTFEELFGFERCEDGSFEVGYEKVVIFELGGAPQHLAKQLSTGEWISKLGDLEDIVHDSPNNLNGPYYGQAVRFLKKKVSAQ